MSINYLGSSLEEGISEFDLLLVPYGKVYLHYDNINCSDSTDKLVIKRTYYQIESNLQDSDDEEVIEGCSNNVIYLKDRMAMGWHYKEGMVIRNGVESYFIDSIYVKEGDTTFWNVEY